MLSLLSFVIIASTVVRRSESFSTTDSWRLRVTPTKIPLAASRRDFFAATVVLGPHNAVASERVPEARIKAELSKVPFFAITTSDGDSPYFTAIAKNDSPIAYFFSERSDAEALLPQVRKTTDPAAIVSAIPFDQAWELVSNPNEKEYGGLFQLQASRRQVVNANGNSGQDQKLDRDNRVPLFFDRRVVIPGARADASFPFFFKYEDLKRVYAAGSDGLSPEEKKLAGPLAVEVTTLDRAVSAMREGSIENAGRIVFVSSEKF
mmetsp:Transcript_44981/g.101542  ORF Transcript_44981/g.101542 Transcript_44981/m.101542 type:complete len:263 (-) Transcript_44981:221-1009(-)